MNKGLCTERVGIEIEHVEAVSDRYSDVGDDAVLISSELTTCRLVDTNQHFRPSGLKRGYLPASQHGFTPQMKIGISKLRSMIYSCVP